MKTKLEEYVKWLENRIEVCLEDKDTYKENIGLFCQALRKFKELALIQPLVSGTLPLEEELSIKIAEMSDEDFEKNCKHKRQ